MLDIFIYGFLIFSMLLGIIAAVYLLMMRLLRPKAPGRFIVVIPGGATGTDLASLVCAARMRLGLLGDIARSEVIALDCGLPEASRRQCEALCHEMDHVRICSPEELLEHLTR
ncbi:MAG: hypothetical protein LBC83_00585 [Oscillospiraceae bacterium]|nr:hypothetical protein [Oscillospiraceae bacterium]